VRPARLLWALFLALLAMAGLQWLTVAPPVPREDLPWTPLDLRDPIGLFTGTKLARLRDDPGLCRRLLEADGVPYRWLAPRRDGACGWDDAVILRPRPHAPRPTVPLTCSLAAGVELWMARVVQPAARDLLGSPVVAVRDFGSYACRPIRGGGDWSQHAYANAIDIAGFGLADGRLVTVAGDWRRPRTGAFLHHVRDGACRLFGTTLSPDYNWAHRDHLHLDGAPSWTGGTCR
jgi:hypothetical protein